MAEDLRQRFVVRVRRDDRDLIEQVITLWRALRCDRTPRSEETNGDTIVDILGQWHDQQLGRLDTLAAKQGG